MARAKLTVEIDVDEDALLDLGTLLQAVEDALEDVGTMASYNLDYPAEKDQQQDLQTS